MSNQDLNMRYVAAALLAAQGGQEVSAANIKKILRYIKSWNIFTNIFKTSMMTTIMHHQMIRVIITLLHTHWKQL